jgi:hypothetical protein
MKAGEILATALTGIITVGIVAVIVRKGGSAPQLITGFSQTLAGVIKAAVGQGQHFTQPALNPAEGIGTPSVGLVGPRLSGQP